VEVELHSFLTSAKKWAFVVSFTPPSLYSRRSVKQTVISDKEFAYNSRGINVEFPDCSES
jgi:hypothetical protein